MDKKVYYNYDKLASFDALFSFVLGGRGIGKTYSAISNCIKDFLKNGNQFVYVRRYQSELDKAAPDFFEAHIANGEFEDHTFSVKMSKKHGTRFYIDGDLAGHGIALTTSMIWKSTPFPLVRTIIYDEFCITQGCYRYLSNEVTLFLELFETIARSRDNVRVWFLGNSTSVTNPYFSYWNLTIPYEGDFRRFRDGLIVVNSVSNEAFREQKRKTRFGQLISGTKYGDYAIDNDFLQDNTVFVRKRPSDAGWYFNLQMDGTIYGVWLDSQGNMYISKSYEPNSSLTFAFSQKDHTETTILQSRISGFVKNIIQHFREGHLIFESIEIKAIFSQNLLKFVN